jgi:HlyD family secretion protein
VKSPIDGVVVNRLVDVGQSVQSSMNITPFFMIATDLRSLQLTAGVDEAEIGKIRPGMDVMFEVDTYQNQQFQGKVESVRLNASTQNNVVTYPVWINVPNPDLRLRPSLTATVRIIINTATDVVRIPNQALRFRPTNDMYTALGLTPPPPPTGGRAGGRGDAGAGPAGAQAPAAGVPAAPPPSATAAADAGRQQPAAATAPANPARGGGGQAAQAGPQGQGGGRAGGRGGNFANLSPEERQRLMAASGRNGGGGRGGRGGAAAAPPAPSPADLPPNQKIDDLFAPLQIRPQTAQVWTWNPDTKELTALRITTGLNDGQFSQLLGGDVAAGQQVVTNIILPASAQNANSQQSIFGQQGGRGGFGQQGGFGGGGGGGGGGRGGGGFGDR